MSLGRFTPTPIPVSLMCLHQMLIWTQSRILKNRRRRTNSLGSNDSYKRTRRF